MVGGKIHSGRVQLVQRTPRHIAKDCPEAGKLFGSTRSRNGRLGHTASPLQDAPWSVLSGPIRGHRGCRSCGRDSRLRTGPRDAGRLAAPAVTSRDYQINAIVSFDRTVKDRLTVAWELVYAAPHVPSAQ